MQSFKTADHSQSSHRVCSWFKRSFRVAHGHCCYPIYVYMINMYTHKQSNVDHHLGYVGKKSLFSLHAYIYSWLLSLEGISMWTRSPWLFNASSCPAGPAVMDVPVDSDRANVFYTLVSSPFMSMEQWSLSLCSLLWWEAWACFFFSTGRIPSSSWIRRATSGERWSCLLPGGGGW